MKWPPFSKMTFTDPFCCAFFLKFHLNEFIRDAIDGSATSVQIMMTIDSVIKVQ